MKTDLPPTQEWRYRRKINDYFTFIVTIEEYLDEHGSEISEMRIVHVVAEDFAQAEELAWCACGDNEIPMKIERTHIPLILPFSPEPDAFFCEEKNERG